jgi:hypothetical protein
LAISAVVGGLVISVVFDDLYGELRERDRRACEQVVQVNNDVVRSVVREATKPTTTIPSTLPEDPNVDPATVRYIRGVLDAIQARSGDSDTRDRLLAQAPRLRCTEAGVPVPEG